MKCKICGQKGGVYALLRLGRCVHCNGYIKGKLNPTPGGPSKEWLRYAIKSEKACDRWLKKKEESELE